MRADDRMLGAVLEALPDPAVVTDSRRRIVLVNREALATFGYGPAELLRRPLEVLLPVVVDGGPVFGRRRDGSEFLVEARVRPARTRSGPLEIVCVRGIGETRVDQAARQAERLVTFGLLTAEVAHESKNALGILWSRIDLMLLEAEEIGLPEVVREDLVVLQRAARRVAATFERLLGYAAPPQQTDGPVDLSHMVGQTLALLERPLTRGGIWVSTDLAPALPSIRGDAEALQELLVNLIVNAREAMPEGGALHVQTRPTSDRARVRLVVADNGPGLPAEVVGRLWQPFSSTKARGHGHGLASIGRIVRAHGAAIEVQSEPGRGTAFIVTFPTRAAGDERGDNRQEPAADTEKAREYTHAPSGSENSG